MILTCPSCATSYFTPDDAIGPAGRSVRCKACRHTWRATLDEPLELTGDAPASAKSPVTRSLDTPETLAETPAPELPKAFRAKAQEQRRLRRAATHGVIWSGVACGFAALLGAAWLFRVDVVELAPRTAQAYAAVGLTVNPTGLEFEGVTARPSPEDPSQVLISGNLRNVRDDERVAPPVRVALLDKDGAEIGHAVVRIDAAPVLPGKAQAFSATIADPGARGQGVGVTFVLNDQGEAPKAHAAAKDGHDDPDHGGEPAHSADDHAGTREAAPTPPAAPVALRPALPALGSDSAPVEAKPIDTRAAEAVSASHG